MSVFSRSRGRSSRGDAQLLVGLVIGCHVALRLDDRGDSFTASCRALPGVVVTCSATMLVGRPVFGHVSVIRQCA